MEIILVSFFIRRLVAFQEELTSSDKTCLSNVLEARGRVFASKLPEFTRLNLMEKNYVRFLFLVKEVCHINPTINPLKAPPKKKLRFWHLFVIQMT